MNQKQLTQAIEEGINKSFPVLYKMECD